MRTILTLLLLAGSVNAQTPNNYSPLQEWLPWVKAGHPEWECPWVRDGFQCAWPGSAVFEMGAQGGRFTAAVELLRKTQLALPGTEAALPFDIEVLDEARNRVTFGLFLRERVPHIELQPGRYTIHGEFAWNDPPRELAVPGEYGLISFSPPRPFRREGALVTFAEDQAAPAIDGVSLFVARKVDDSSPLSVETRLDLQVSGGVRTVNFGRVTVAGSLPVSIASDLTHQLTADGILSLQLRPGQYLVTIHEVLAQPVQELRAPEPSFWPEQETWAWNSNPEFRTVEITGGEPVSAKLTQLPPDWHGGASYLVNRGQSLTLEEVRRGEERPQESELSLHRELWLDADGSGFTIADHFGGRMTTRFRLDASPDLKLGRAEVDGMPAFITQSPTDGAPGIELRRTDVNALAISRLVRESSLPAVGWKETLHTLSGTFYLPPSWKLLHLSDALNTSTTWLNSWDLLDVFVAVLLVIAALRLFGWQVGVLVAAISLFTHGEFLEPRFALIHLLIGGAVWFITRSSQSWLRESVRLYLFGLLLIWVAEVLTFSKLQLTQLLFPQLESGTRFRTASQSMLLGLESNFFAIPALLAILFPLGALRHFRRTKSHGSWILWPMLFGMGMISFVALSVLAGNAMGRPAYHAHRGAAASVAQSSGSYADSEETPASVLTGKLKKDSVQSTSRNIQSGPALPSWQWRSFPFSFRGPVAPDTRFSVFLLSPTANRILSGLRIFLLASLSVYLWRRLQLTSVAALLLLAFLPQNAGADYPDTGLLAKLEERLAAEICQSDTCGTVERLEIRVSGSDVTLSLVTMGRGLSAVPLPGPLDELPISSVSVDGKVSTALRSDNERFLWVKVPRGRAVIEARGRLAPGVAATLRFSQTPFHVDFASEEWTAEGISQTGAVTGSIRILPRSGTVDGAARQNVVLPSWFIVKRLIELGDEYTTSTTVERIGDNTSLATATFSLLPEERVLSGDVGIHDSTASVRFPPGVQSISVNGVLPPSGSVRLTAKPAPSASEQWFVRCASFLRCTAGGVRPQQSVVEGEQLSLWLPFPGEEVTVEAKLLAGAAGDSLTVDSLSHDLHWGSTLQEGMLKVRIRATQQTSYSLDLPREATLKRDVLNGIEGSAVVSDRRVTFLVNPGAHDLEVYYSLPKEVATLEQMPPVGSSAPAHNVSIHITPSYDRWLLWVNGPAWGPAVLFWAKFLILAGFMAALAKYDLLPFRPGGAALFALGVATLPLIAVFVPLLWLIVIQKSEATIVVTRRFGPTFRVGTFTLLTAIAILYLYAMIHQGLVVTPQMLIVGNSSTSSLLSWFADHPGAQIPQPWVLSLPLWCWRTVMLLWSTWLAITLFRWLRKSVEIIRRLASAEGARATT